MHWFNNKWTNNFSGSYVNEFRIFITLVHIDTNEQHKLNTFSGNFHLNTLFVDLLNLNCTMYLRVADVTTQIQQRTLALHVVALLDVSLGTQCYTGVRAVCTCWYLKCRWGHKGHCAVMHKNKEVGERYGDATVLFGSVDLSVNTMN